MVGVAALSSNTACSPFNGESTPQLRLGSSDSANLDAANVASKLRAKQYYTLSFSDSIPQEHNHEGLGISISASIREDARIFKSHFQFWLTFAHNSCKDSRVPFNSPYKRTEFPCSKSLSITSLHERGCVVGRNWSGFLIQ